jgi:hypothetical protein
VDARKLGALEKLFDEPFDGSKGADPVYNSGPWVNASYKDMYEMYYAQMMSQTHLKNFYGHIANSQSSFYHLGPLKKQYQPL